MHGQLTISKLCSKRVINYCLTRSLPPSTKANFVWLYNLELLQQDVTVSILVGLLQFFVYDISVAHLNIEYGKIFSKKSLQSTKTASNNHFDVSSDMMSSVTRSGDLLDFGQLLKAFGNNLFAQISHILRQFL